MLYESIFVPPGSSPWPRKILDDPQIAHYLANWGRAGDYAVVATREGLPVGATWYRLMSLDDPGFGFVAADVPELGIALRPMARDQGIGTALLLNVIGHARDAGYRALSLSVQPENPALRLYQRLGFVTVGSDGDALTMLRAL